MKDMTFNLQIMRSALSERYVKGTSACACLTNVGKKKLNVQSVEGFSSYHNIAYETSTVRISKSYGIGLGKLILFDGVFKKHQSSTDLVVVKDFFPLSRILIYISQHLPAMLKRKGFFLVLSLSVRRSSKNLAISKLT